MASPFPPQIQVPQAGPTMGGDSAGVPGAPDNPDAAQALQDAIASVRTYLDAEKDEQDKAAAAGILAKLHQLQGGHAKEQQAALGGGPATNYLRRTVGA